MNGLRRARSIARAAYSPPIMNAAAKATPSQNESGKRPRSLSARHKLPMEMRNAHTTAGKTPRRLRDNVRAALARISERRCSGNRAKTGNSSREHTNGRGRAENSRANQISRNTAVVTQAVGQNSAQRCWTVSIVEEKARSRLTTPSSATAERGAVAAW